MQLKEQPDLIKPDIIATDKHGDPIVGIYISTYNVFSDYGAEIINFFEALPETIDFVMVVDLENIRIWRKNLTDPVSFLNTSSILQSYDPSFSTKTIFPAYLATLIQAWLRDLAYHWQSSTPPALEEIEKIGLQVLLFDGYTTVMD